MRKMGITSAREEFFMGVGIGCEMRVVALLFLGFLFGRRLSLAAGGVELCEHGLQTLPCGNSCAVCCTGRHRLFHEWGVRHVEELAALVQFPAVIAHEPSGIELREHPLT